MDYSKITLGELLTSSNPIIQRNALSILKTLQKKRKCPAHDWDAYGKCCICGMWKHQLPQEEIPF